MNINERAVQGVTILHLNGTLALGAGAGVLRDKMRALVREGRRDFLLDLSQVGSIDSTGISELIGAYTTAKKAGGSVKFVNVTKFIHDLLAITKLLLVFELFTNEADALRSFSAQK
jgi:anti-sigma B factor antagonist